MAEKQNRKKPMLSEDPEKKRRTAGQKKAVGRAGNVKYKQKEQYEGEDAQAESRGSRSKGADKKVSASKKKHEKEQVNIFEEDDRSRSIVHLIIPVALFLTALFLSTCYIMTDVFSFLDTTKGVGEWGIGLRNLFCGLFGYGAFFLPILMGILAVVWRSAVRKNAWLARVLYAVAAALIFSAFMHAVLGVGAGDWHVSEGIVPLWQKGVSLQGGGVIGGLLGELLSKTGMAGSMIFGIPATIIFFLLLCGVSPSYVITAIRYEYKEWRIRHEERRQVRQEEKAEAAEQARIEKQEKREAEKQQRAKEAAEKKEQKEKTAAAEAEQKKKQAEEEKAASAPVIRPSEEESMKKGAPAVAEESAEEQPDEYAPEETRPLIIIPPKAQEHTDKKKADSEDGVYHSLEEIPPVRSGEEGSESYSLEEIFNHEKPLTKEEKESMSRGPVREGDGNERSEVDMRLLTELKPITDIDEIPDLEDGIEEIAVEVEEEREYVFPPIGLLAEDTNKHDEDVTAELMDNAQKLMDTLKSFKVGIKEITYSRGPTITRYELKPDVGIRVRSIANLVDDIALSLATTGVRIEAPIPNKPAVGIEVPNQNPNTVFLRSLIETEKFAGESSKLTACLGADVGGKPMYFNIAKMPHLLIAGATGMGKSVCINSIIVSLLYKARPDEVKLILIDPKKVEFNIYKDIPHLYAPIVSEPAKAAGALASAVAEMERRFELIEEVGVRDIYNYNAVTKDDPDREFMPQMVIIIDELADLMMTAPDAVESSICRLAQKARAAGIHIIIGTQRPSVDVITGLIKANIPSRIAFTVASQVDSRTIIDIAGAEKLIGRGDMLFAPVGAAKPMRVQGAFVHENEVEKIVEFIKANNCGAKYNDEFMSRIEEEAAKCTAGKKGSGGGSMPDGDMDSDGLDPKFREAVKVAVETGRVATSLLQRKLEIGYGRAAKIIDQMEEMGYVSAPEGNKPRKILISKEDFMQMSINDDI